MLSKRFFKRFVWLLLPVLALAFCGACSIEIAPKAQTDPAASRDVAAELDNLNIDTYITLNNAQTAVTGHGAVFANGVLTIGKSGTYSLKGKLSEGRIVVNTADDAKVKLLLDGVEIQSTQGAPICIENAAKETKLLLAANSENKLTDAGTTAQESDGDLFGAVVFSKDDLEIGGLGTLTIKAQNKGVFCKDDLQISGGTLRITSGDDALRGKDSLEISGGALEIEAGGDGLRTSNEEKGSLCVSGGKIKLESAADAIQSAGDLLVSGGTLNLTAGGGFDQSRMKSAFAPFAAKDAQNESDVSAKGLKAAGDIAISGGSVAIDALDDGVHADRNAAVSGGALVISSNDDAVHADQGIIVSGGSITVKTAYEGLEAKTVTVSGGNLDLTAIDDGINAAAADDQSETAFFPGAGNAGGEANGQTPPAGLEPPAGMEPPEGFTPPAGAEPPEGYPAPDGEPPERPNGQQGGGPSGFGFARRPGGDKGVGTDRYDADSQISISGGSITINAGGDGVDTNGDIRMSAGSLTVFGPVNNGNGALDYAGSFELTGGTVLAVGSAGMAQGVSKGSACLQANCSAGANDRLEIQSESGKTLVSVTLPKQISNVVYGGSLSAGKTYTILVNGEAAATATAN